MRERTFPALLLRALLIFYAALFQTLSANSAWAEKSPQSSVQGSVTLKVAGAERELPTTVVTLQSLSDPKRDSETATEHRISMKGKSFEPDTLIVRPGDSVVFDNDDPYRHNVFSLSGDNSFDLGTYSGGKDGKFTFLHSGKVKVYCNIHPEMAAQIIVTTAPFGTIIRDSSNFEMQNVPPGEYRLSVWNVFGETTQELSLKPGEVKNSLVTIESLLLADQDPNFHMRKDGRKYSKGLAQSESY